MYISQRLTNFLPVSPYVCNFQSDILAALAASYILMTNLNSAITI